MEEVKYNQIWNLESKRNSPQRRGNGKYIKWETKQTSNNYRIKKETEE